MHKHRLTPFFVILLYVLQAVIFLVIYQPVRNFFLDYLMRPSVPLLDVLCWVVPFCSVTLECLLPLSRSHLIHSLDRKTGLILNSILLAASIFLIVWYWIIKAPLMYNIIFHTTIILLVSSLFDEILLLAKGRKKSAPAAE